MITSLIIFVLLFSILVFLFRIYVRRLWLPPGPFPLPLIGNLHQLDYAKPHETCLKWSKIYGPVFTVWFAHQPMIMITDYDLMKEATSGKRLADRPDIFLFSYLNHGNSGLTFATGALWEDQRKFTMQTFHEMTLGENILEETISTEAKSLIELIFNKMGSKKRTSMNLYEPIAMQINSIVLSLLFGRKFDKTHEQFLNLARATEETVDSLFFDPMVFVTNCWPWLRRLPIFHHFGFDQINHQDKTSKSFFSHEIEINKQEFELNQNDDSNSTNFTTAYLKEMQRRQKIGDMGYFNDWQLLMNTIDLFGAGTDMVSNTLHMAILAMVQHPIIQAKVHQEIDNTIGRDKTPTMSDRQFMPYVSATLTEVQRWAISLPINFSHTNETDFQLAGYTIPKNTHVIPQISVLNIDERVFPQPNLFMPERFLDDDKKSSLKIKQFAPFSMGKRQCLGEGVAKMELFLIFVSLMQKLQFSPSETLEEMSTKPVRSLSTSYPNKYVLLVTVKS